MHASSFCSSCVYRRCCDMRIFSRLEVIRHGTVSHCRCMEDVRTARGKIGVIYLRHDGHSNGSFHRNYTPTPTLTTNGRTIRNIRYTRYEPVGFVNSVHWLVCMHTSLWLRDCRGLYHSTLPSSNMLTQAACICHTTFSQTFSNGHHLYPKETLLVRETPLS